MNKYWSKRLSGIEPYVPGEQPRQPGLIKLNTNENPYPPSPLAVKALEEGAGSLRLYPDTGSDTLRDVIGGAYGLEREQIFIGNGSDEVLAFAFMAFFDPGRPVTYADITYSFYPVYADFFGLDSRVVPLDDDFRIPVAAFCEKSGGVALPNPNAPTGIALDLEDIERIVAADPDRVVIIDEAYIDFGGESAVPLVGRYPNLLVVQTMSKSRSLAGLRVGFAMGHPELIAALDCVKNSINSYTMDRCAQAGAAAAFADGAYFQETRRKIMATRERAAAALEALGFLVLPSKANFLFIRHKSAPGAEIFQRLREKHILVRYFNKPRIDSFLRVTVGTDAEMDALISALEVMLP